MNKRIKLSILALVVILSLLISSMSVYAEPSTATDAGLNVSETSLHIGDTVVVTLKVPAITEKFASAGFKVKFDNTAFEATEVTAPTITGCSAPIYSNPSEANAAGNFAVAYNSTSYDADVTFNAFEFSATFSVLETAELKEYTFEIIDCDIGAFEDDGFTDKDIAPTMLVTSVAVTVFEAVVTEIPATEAPATEAPATEVPATEVPATEAPATEVPATEAPATEAPATEVPVTEAPATEVPVTEAPTTEAPATEAPATETPATEVPAPNTGDDDISFAVIMVVFCGAALALSFIFKKKNQE